MIKFPKSLMSLSFLLTLFLQISHILSMFIRGSKVNYTTVITLAFEAGISIKRAKKIAKALKFERSYWTIGSIESDEFYSNVSHNISSAPSGSLLNVQVNVNALAYSLPPDIALSQIMFVSETLNETKIPALTYMLWPYAPRLQEDGYTIVVGAYSGGGTFGNCGSSLMQNLIYHLALPFTLAM